MQLDYPRSYLVEFSDEEKQNEIWKDIIGYEGYYQISNLGRVKSLARTVTYTKYEYQTKRIREVTYRVKWCIIKPNIHKDFYWNVPLTRDGITTIHLLHRLIATAFIPNPNEYECVNHIDLDKRNIRISNLEWVSSSMNVNHSVQTFNNKQAKPVYCLSNSTVYASCSQADRHLHLVSGTVWSVLNSNQKSQYLFRYATNVEIAEAKSNLKLDYTNLPDWTTASIVHKIKCVNNNIIYDSSIAASKLANVSDSMIMYAIDHRVLVNGYCFYDVNDPPENETEYFVECTSNSSLNAVRHGTWVHCITDDIYISTLKSASEYADVSVDTLKKYIKLHRAIHGKLYDIVDKSKVDPSKIYILDI